MNIYGENVYLRAICVDDIEGLIDMINDPDDEFMVGGWSFPVSIEKQRDWVLKKTLSDDLNNLRLAVCLNQSSELVGFVSLTSIDYKNGTAEIGVKILKKFRGKSVAKESIRLILEYGIDELRLVTIYSIINSHNEKSVNFFKKLGFNYEGLLKSRLYKRGGRVDVVSMAIYAE